ncbi:MAG: DUF2188 domain-containing protein [Cyclobacteriaceae bacterium]
MMERKKFYIKALGKKAAANAKHADSKRYHVISSDSEKWAVVADGSTRASKIFTTKLGAIKFAEENATKQNGDVAVHSKTGGIDRLFSYAK